jgi:hypothetical protein
MLTVCPSLLAPPLPLLLLLQFIMRLMFKVPLKFVVSRQARDDLERGSNFQLTHRFFIPLTDVPV